MLTRRDWLRHHLRANHFPPLSHEYVELADHAIELCRDGEHEALVELPGGAKTTAAECVRAMHLATFLDGEPAE